MKKYWTEWYRRVLLVMLLLPVVTFASAQTTTSTYSEPEMATGFYADGKIYIVIGVIAIVLIGIVLYLMRIDKKISKLEKEVNSK